ncbi:hypothetical protein [Aquipseudomonas ullengensis]|uniref:Uncharacterized protein n=1 Tax=Aquipseudomonas ullengensis TaxID=2759166 RepID=A0A7W4LM88_9GAMM|nr:hypothetical protein [Pseudomonas ullengensis]MBB2495728.1 hypothetical protein [Pseudomonas ullengensis]
MRIVATLVCALLLSPTLPSLAFAGSDCKDAGSASDVRDCLRDQDSDQKGKGNCNEKGNCDKAKGKSKDDYDNDDYLINCHEINSLTLRRECLDKRRD